MKAPSSDKVVTTLRLTPAKHRELRVAVAGRGTSMQKVLEQAIDSWLIREGDGRTGRGSGYAVSFVVRTYSSFVRKNAARRFGGIGSGRKGNARRKRPHEVASMAEDAAGTPRLPAGTILGNL
jgi:hypothetical protein